MRFSVFLLAAVSTFAAEIPQGAHVLLRMENSITTRTAQDGDYVYLRTSSPVSVAGAIILPVGSYVQGVVTNARRSGRVKGRAELAIRLETITLPSGPVYKFSPKLASVDSPGNGEQKVAGKENSVQEGSTHGQDAARIAILAGSGGALGAIVDQGGGEPGSEREQARPSGSPPSFSPAAGKSNCAREPRSTSSSTVPSPSSSR